MLRLIGLVVSIGLADSLKPTTVGPGLFLASGERAGRAVLEFALTVFSVFLLAGLVLVVGPGHAILALAPHPGATTRYVLETVAGATMLAGAAWLWLRRDTLRRRGSGEARPGQRSPLRMGATIAAVELPSAFPYFAAIVALVGSGLILWSQLALLVVFNVCFVLPLLVIAAAVALAGGRGVERMAEARRYLQARWPQIAAVVAVLAGLFVITLGVTGLAGRSGGDVGHVSRDVRHRLTHPPGG